MSKTDNGKKVKPGKSNHSKSSKNKALNLFISNRTRSDDRWKEMKSTGYVERLGAEAK